MAANSSAHSAKAGYNQSGGAYFVCVTALSGSLGTGVDAVTPSAALTTTSSHLYKISTAGAKSGGAYEAPILTRVSAQEVFNAITDKADEAAAEFAAGKLIKDMGKTIVDINGRTFRKFAVASTSAKYGVVGGAAVAPGAGYGSFYLDVGREGNTGTTLPAPIARYF
jgi:hypothetical protein